MNKPVHILYRISDAGNPKTKLPGVSKWDCLQNAIQIFEGAIFHVFADRCSQNTLTKLSEMGLKPQVLDLGNAGSWLFAANYALQNTGKSDILYFLEDDYLHLSGAMGVLQEGIGKADYVSLYDHPDKYQEDLNPYVEAGGEWSKVLSGSRCHWKTSNSTTMTFGVMHATLLEDLPVWQQFCEGGFPDDFGAFQHLQGIGSWENVLFGKRRRLVTPLPSFSTHIETEFLAPGKDWTALIA